RGRALLMFIPDRAHGIEQNLAAQTLCDEHDRPVISTAEITDTEVDTPAAQNRTDLAEHKSPNRITVLARISDRIDEAVIHQSLFETPIEAGSVIRILTTRRRRGIIGLEQRLVRNGQRRPDDESDIERAMRCLEGNRDGIGSVAGNGTRILGKDSTWEGAARDRNPANDPTLVMAAHAVRPKNPGPNARRDQ